MIVITGAAGFVGWNLHLGLRKRKKDDILLVDFKEKFSDDFITTFPTADPFVFLENLKNPTFAKKIEVVFHQGACSDTTNYNPHYMLKHNFDYTVYLARLCMQHGIRLIYASSAAVYGDGPFNEFCRAPLRAKNLYAKSKKLVDEYLNNFMPSPSTQIVGLRYFNVYGPHEHRKGHMASVMCQFKKQIENTQTVTLFEHSQDYLRDFIYIDDVVKVNLHFFDNPHISGIYNCGTGEASAFTHIPQFMAKYYDFVVRSKPMPTKLVGKYQRFTKASLDNLRNAGDYEGQFLTLEEGIDRYAQYWQQ